MPSRQKQDRKAGDDMEKPITYGWSSASLQLDRGISPHRLTINFVPWSGRVQWTRPIKHKGTTVLSQHCFRDLGTERRNVNFSAIVPLSSGGGGLPEFDGGAKVVKPLGTMLLLPEEAL